VKYAGRKLFVSVLVGIFALSGAAFAAEEATRYVNHSSGAILDEDGKPVYGSATFQYIQFSFMYEGYKNGTDEGKDGVFTFEKGASYSYPNEGGRIKDILETDSSPVFPLYYESTESTFAPKWSATTTGWINFMRAAETGLPGKNFSWEIYEIDEKDTGTVPNFLPTKKQVEQCVPFVTLKDDSVELSLVDKTGNAVAAPYSGTYRVRLSYKDGRTPSTKDWSLTSKEMFTESFSFPGKKEDISEVRVDFRPTIEGETMRYRWRFYPAEEDGEGVTADVDEELNVEAGKEYKIPVTFDEGYWPVRDTLYPAYSTDPSVVTVTVDYDDATFETDRTVTVKLKGVKAGKAKIGLVYRDNSGYYAPTLDVAVSGGEGSSGGGCNAGYGVVGLLFLGFALRKYLTL
jgi:hypothetical protein